MTDDEGPNSHIALIPLWQFTLGKRDALLVLKALGGRLANEQEIQAASELCDRLTLQRGSIAQDFAKGITVASEHVLQKGIKA